MHDPDHDLVTKSKAGDKAAFGKLVKQYYDMVYVLAYGVLHHHEKARDVAQNVFLKAYRDIGNFEQKSKFKTWLYRISINAALDEIRKKQPTQSIDGPENNDEGDSRPMQLRDSREGPRDQASQRELRELLDKAIARLSAEHRAVLVLREWQGLSYEEISATLKIELGTVMSRLHYARRKLGEILGSFNDPVLKNAIDTMNHREGDPAER